MSNTQRAQLEALANWNKAKSIEAQKAGFEREADRLWSNYIRLKKQLRDKSDRSLIMAHTTMLFMTWLIAIFFTLSGALNFIGACVYNKDVEKREAFVKYWALCWLIAISVLYFIVHS